MKTLKTLLLIVLVSLIFASCGTKETSKEVVSTASVVEEVKIEFSDPARMGGKTNFGALFITMFRHSEYDMALKFTSKGSIEKFGIEKIKEVYASFPYNYNLHLADAKSKNDTLYLSFSTNEHATGKIKHMKVVIENDSCKLVLPDKLDDLLK